MPLRALRSEFFPEHIVAVCRELRAAGFAAWMVGGAVRDLLAGRAAKDFDVATSARPEDMTRVFGARRTVPTGEKHGTMTILVTARDGKRGHVEVTTFRGEGAYSDGRRPDSITFVDDLTEDLRRRDFTMNAIAYDAIDDVIADPFGGRADLEAGVIRAVGDAVERFSEDGLRPLRAVRFAAQLEFAIDAPTLAAVARTLDVFRKVSAERVRDELVKILGARRPSLGLELMRTTGLLAIVIPELLEGVGFSQNRFHAHDVWQHTLAVVDATPLFEAGARAPWVVRMAALLHDVAKPRTAAAKPDEPGERTFFRHELVGADMSEDIARRLRFSNHERELVTHLVRNHMFWYSPEWSDGTVRRFIGRVGLEAVPDLFALRTGDVLGRGRGEDPEGELGELRRRIDEQVQQAAALKVSDLAIDGQEVMRILGCPPGRIVGDVLRRLLDGVLDDASSNTPEILRARVAAIAAELRARAD